MALLPPKPPKGRKRSKFERRLTSRGQATLYAYESLFPQTLDLAARAAEEYGPLYRAEAEKARADELESFLGYAPRYVEAIDAADPLQAKARAGLFEDVIGGLEDPAGLSPSLRNEVQQASRAAYAARGLNYSPAAGAAELFASGERGQQLRQQNLEAALQALYANQRIVGDPFLAMTGRPSRPQGADVQAPQYGAFTNDLFSYGVNRELLQLQLSAAKDAATKGLIGQVAGGALGAGGAIGAAFV